MKELETSKEQKWRDDKDAYEKDCMDEEKLTQAATRYRTLVRAINTRRGMRRKDDKPPENHWKKRFPELEKELLDTYYAFKGWNEQGIPTQESQWYALHCIPICFVIQDIQIGIDTGSTQDDIPQMGHGQAPYMCVQSHC